MDKAIKSILALSLGGMMLLAMSCEKKTTSNEATAESDESALAAQATPATPAEQGKELFMSYCAICHGEKGDGNGSMADMLKAAPANLTTIASRRNGAFPKDEIYQIIDGRVPLPGHGTGEMPVWGKTFMSSENLDDEEQMKEKINNLVAYLETLQQ